MKIFKLEVKNFRLLKDFSLDVENELSLIIGKNNSGKTSILNVLNKFLSNNDANSISINDFNLDFKDEICKLLKESIQISESDYMNKNILMYLRIFISYDESDNLRNISDLIMDLDPNHNVIVLSFEYGLSYNGFKNMKLKYDEHLSASDAEVQIKLTENEFLLQEYTNYFVVNKLSLGYDYEKNNVNPFVFINLKEAKIDLSNVINFKLISAKRDVANKDNNSTLSRHTASIYKRTESSSQNNIAVERFKNKLSSTDKELNKIYREIFSNVINKVNMFGGFTVGESDIKVISNLQHQELLEGNTLVTYNHGGNQLPEHYNGLGYMNLISIIFEIEILINQFKRDGNPADINLLFIEEPEAHTHPQMQYVFIKNIKSLLKDGIIINEVEQSSINLQYFISTHSAHIVSDCDFNDIKYFIRIDSNSVKAKNIKDLENEYKRNGEDANYRFLKQYLTINRAELFFADKAIFIEGDTERILLPVMMKKIDLEKNSKNLLLSQNVSIIEVGNYSHIFEKFINFISVKSLIITDIDSVKRIPMKNTDGTYKLTKSGEQRYAKIECPTIEADETSNASLKYFYKHSELRHFTTKQFKDKILKKDDATWQLDETGQLCVICQTEEEGYLGRSFEDAFFCINNNIAYIKKNRSKFVGLKNKSLFYANTDPFMLAEKCINSKSQFAIDIIRNSNENFSNWEIPVYIREGLEWLRD
ncbi:MAG: ATP-dependent endonuclease [Sphingobacteriaceae bacterium]|nr:ATP-dependent endonuclease [Sphingobacteriaceae bacterium]